MELTVLNKQFEAIRIIDSFESSIWTDRFNTYGDFELYCNMSEGMLDILQKDFYLINPDSDHVMIIDKIEIKTDSEDGDKLIVTGKSLESILQRRIIWGNKDVNAGLVYDRIVSFIKEAITESTLPKRIISNFIIDESTDEVLKSIWTDASQYNGDNLYEVISNLCIDNGIGFKIALTDEFEFKFSFYMPVDRSYNQDENPYVVFSPEFDNIINSDYTDSNEEYKNVALVMGEGNGNNRKTAEAGDVTGLDRREVFIDANDLSKTVNGTTLSDANYLIRLKNRGLSDLVDMRPKQEFDGEVDITRLYRYKEDFNIGDLVELENQYGISKQTRISEIIFSQDDSGYSVYPTFEVVNYELTRNWIFKEGVGLNIFYKKLSNNTTETISPSGWIDSSVTNQYTNIQINPVIDFSKYSTLYVELVMIAKNGNVSATNIGKIGVGSRLDAITNVNNIFNNSFYTFVQFNYEQNVRKTISVDISGIDQFGCIQIALQLTSGTIYNIYLE